tara:strand:- start:565 stop:1473 length:909 start_codon:yes stop_codon:yes gene_type:complete
MKQFIKNICICFVVLFIVDKSAYFILKKTPKHLYDTRLKQVLEGEINKDLIVLGSSKGAGNILASQIEAETGLKSYNLSYMGSDITFHNFILKTLLTHNKTPKTILLSIDNPATLINEKTLNFRLDKLYPLSIYNEINFELINQNDRSILSKYFLLARLTKAHLYYTNEKPTIDNPILQDGSMPFVRINPKAKREFISKDLFYNIDDEQPHKLEALNNIQNLCKANNINLYYIFSPKMFSFNDSFYNRFLQLSHNEKNIFRYNNKDSIYNLKSTYFDQSHLMINGAKVFTSEISNFIKSKNP